MWLGGVRCRVAVDAVDEHARELGHWVDAVAVIAREEEVEAEFGGEVDVVLAEDLGELGVHLGRWQGVEGGSHDHAVGGVLLVKEVFNCL